MPLAACGSNLLHECQKTSTLELSESFFLLFENILKYFKTDIAFY